MKANIGCGEHKLDGYINIDFTEDTKPDLVCNIKLDPLPFKDNELDVICAMHILEHIEVKFWDFVFTEFRRTLKVEGELYLAYPEFETCAKYFIENKKGQRDFWRATLYGRQLYVGDYHVVPMRTAEVKKFLVAYGFHNVKETTEDNEEWNAFLYAQKGPKLFDCKEDILRKELFAK